MNTKVSSDDDLIQHLKQFHGDADTTNFGVLDFASAFGSPLEALVYSKLFWPDFVEFEGMIFHAFILESEEDRARVMSALSRGQSHVEVEQSFNSFEIASSFFASKRGISTFADYALLATRMSEMWRARLRELFPERNIIVQLQLFSDEAPTIVVFQEAHNGI